MSKQTFEAQRKFNERWGGAVTYRIGKMERPSLWRRVVRWVMALWPGEDLTAVEILPPETCVPAGWADGFKTEHQTAGRK